jgi:hypothetical protein
MPQTRKTETPAYVFFLKLVFDKAILGGSTGEVIEMCAYIF